MKLNTAIKHFKFNDFQIAVNRLSKSQESSLGSQSLNKIVVAAPNIYDSFTNEDGEYIFVPIYRENEWRSYLIPLDFEHFSTEDLEYSSILPCTQPLSFFYKKIKNIEKLNDFKNLVFMTLFYYETNEELNVFFNYYRKQGVEKFYMYYNGNLAERIKTLPIYDDVEYIEWNFDYWWWKENSKHPKHHAQIPAINVFVKKYKHQFKYAILGDTDEFILTKNYDSISEYLNKNNLNKSVFTAHYYSDINFKTGEFTHQKNSSHHGLRAGKTIVYSGDIKPSSMLSVHQSLSAHYCADFKLFHNKPKHPAAKQIAGNSNFFVLL